MHSVMNYETDGTQAAPKATWKLEFSGVGGDNNSVYTITPTGSSPRAARLSRLGGHEAVQRRGQGVADALESAGLTGVRRRSPPARSRSGPRVSCTCGGRHRAAQRHRGSPQHDGSRPGLHVRPTTSATSRWRLGTCDADVNAIELDKYDDPPNNQKQIGPAHFPDPTPGGTAAEVDQPGARAVATLSKVVQGDPIGAGSGTQQPTECRPARPNVP